MKTDLERKELALRMMEDGEVTADIARVTGFSEAEIRANCLAWSEEVGGLSSPDDRRGRFFDAAKRDLTPTDRMLEVMPAAAKVLESGDIEGFFEKVAPVAAIQMAYDSVFVADDAVRQKAQKDILDRAGYKPREKIEVYTKYDGMQRDEILGLIKGIMLSRPEVLKQIGEVYRIDDGKTVDAEVMEEAPVISGGGDDGRD